VLRAARADAAQTLPLTELTRKRWSASVSSLIDSEDLLRATLELYQGCVAFRRCLRVPCQHRPRVLDRRRNAPRAARVYGHSSLRASSAMGSLGLPWTLRSSPFPAPHNSSGS